MWLHFLTVEPGKHIGYGHSLLGTSESVHSDTWGLGHDCCPEFLQQMFILTWRSFSQTHVQGECTGHVRDWEGEDGSLRTQATRCEGVYTYCILMLSEKGSRNPAQHALEIEINRRDQKRNRPASMMDPDLKLL